MLFLGMGRLPGFAQTGKAYIGYCDGKIATKTEGTITGVTGSNATIDEAICLTHDMLAQYAGMKLTAINAGMPETPNLPGELTAWVRGSKDGANIASGTASTVASGWNEIALASSYTITGKEDELWIGFEFVQTKKLSVISLAGTTDSNGCWVGKNGKFSDYSDKQYGSLSVEGVVESGSIVAHDIAITSAHVQKSLIHLDKPAAIDVTIANNASDEAANPVIVCYMAGKQVGKAVYNGTLKQRELQTVTLSVDPSSMDAAAGDNREGTFYLDLELQWADGSADQRPDDNTAKATVTRSETFYTRRMVVEEGTGAWCGWCVKGIVAMKHMNDAYPDRFIGIAVHNGDEYETADYKYWLSGYFDSYPNCIINRMPYTISPSTDTFEQIMGAFDAETDCDMQLTARLDDNELKLHTATTFLSEQLQSNYRMAFAVCEDQLPIEQTNYYADGANGEMGGFESLPKVAKVNVDDVARAIYPSPEGMENVIPQTIKRLQTYDFDYSVAAPKYANAANLWVAALLIDGTTGEIVQATKARVQTATGIESTRIDAPKNEAVYNLQGQKTSRLCKGINIVNGKKIMVK